MFLSFHQSVPLLTQPSILPPSILQNSHLSSHARESPFHQSGREGRGGGDRQLTSLPITLLPSPSTRPLASLVLGEVVTLRQVAWVVFGCVSCASCTNSCTSCVIVHRTLVVWVDWVAEYVWAAFTQCWMLTILIVTIMIIIVIVMIIDRSKVVLGGQYTQGWSMRARRRVDDAPPSSSSSSSLSRVICKTKKKMIIDCFKLKRNRPHSDLCNQSERKKPSVGECQDLATSDGSNDHDPDAQLLVVFCFLDALAYLGLGPVSAKWFSNSFSF